AVGSYAIALVTTTAVLLSLVILKLPKRWIETRLTKDRDTVIVRVAPGLPSSPVVAAVCAIEGIRIAALHVESSDAGNTINLRAASAPGTGDLSALVAAIADREDVLSVELD
ncbi:MAG TPA: hypothetical protein VF230_07005, partial [Acidimicrobiales bacterium]